MSLDQVNDSDFQSTVIESSTPVVVDFFATWCGPCKVLEGVLEKLAPTYDGKVKIVKCDIEQATQVCADHAVMNVPAVLVFKDGKVADRKQGVSPQPVLDGWIKQTAGI